MSIRYIFCINTGRAGSNYLQSLFEQAQHITSLHEPEPVMQGKVMIDFLDGDETLLREKMPEKIASIQKSIKSGEVYIETNHTFIKGFGWLLPEFIPEEEIGVVLLTRNKTEIAQSLHRLHCNAFNTAGKQWLIHLNAKKKILPIPPEISFPYLTYYSFRFLYRFYYLIRRMLPLKDFFEWLDRIFGPWKNFERTDLRLLEWYVDETFARAELYKKTFLNIRYYSVDINELNNMEKVKELFAFFELQPKGNWEESVGKVVNKKFSDSDGRLIFA